MKKSNSTLIIDYNIENLNKSSSERDNINNNEYNNSISLLKHKIFLEKLLHLIKISQIDYLSQISSNININIRNKIIKNILLNLKNDLIITLKDNTYSKAKLQNTMSSNKSSLVKSLFVSSSSENINLNSSYDKNEEKKNIKKINNDDYYKYNIELPHLKLLNFKIENQLKYINALIKVKNENKSIYIYCDNQKDTIYASNCLHQNLLDSRDKFKLIVKKKEIQNRNLIILKSQVINMKDEVALLGKKSSNEYINTSDIINEESKEYYTKTNICTNENYRRNSNDFDQSFDFDNKVLFPINQIN